MNPTLEIIDEVNVRFRGIPKGIIQDAQSLVTYTVPGSQFMPAVRAGRWDGKIRLIGTNGKTYLSLADEMWEYFAERGYPCEIDDQRHDWSHLIEQIEYPDENVFSHRTWNGEPDGDPIILRDYQLEAVHTALDEGSGLLVMATGAGKSLTCAVLANTYSKVGKVVVIVPTIDLAIQTQATFLKCGLDCGLWYGEMKDARHITMCTWQSLDNAPELMAGVSCVILDEAHQGKAKTLSEILGGPACNVPFRFGCTGTLPKEQIWRKQIEGVLGPEIYNLSSAELRDRDVLAGIQVIQLKMRDSKNPRLPKSERGLHFEDWKDQVDWAFNDHERTARLAEIFIDMAESEGNLLGLIPYKKNGKLLQELTPGSFSVDGDMRPTARRKIYEKFGDMDDGIMHATFGVASTGLDIPRIYVLAYCEAGKKFEKVIQTVGRGLRKAPDKNFVYVLDVYSDVQFSNNHAAERRKFYKQEKIPCEIQEIDYVGT